MTVNLTMKEPMTKGFVPARPFSFYDDGARIHEILRLLLGSVNIFDKDKSKSIILSENYLRDGTKRLAIPSKIMIAVFSNDITIEDYEKFVRAESLRNRDFFTQLQRELTLCLVSRKNGRFTESFLYLYRILEFISLAFPFLYSVTQVKFANSHTFLKSMTSNERDGDLKMLIAALPEISRSVSLNSTTFDFSIAGIDKNFGKALRSEFSRCIIPDVKGLELSDELMEPDRLLRVQFNLMPKLIISIRNRMFHYRVGEANIELSDLGGAEKVCELCIDEFIHWFALLYTGIMKVLAKRII